MGGVVVSYSLHDFFHTVLPESGLVCLGKLAPPKGAPFMHDVYDTIDAAIAALEYADYTKQNYYFCVSTLAERAVEDRGKLRTRTQKNAKYTRCIILDVDIKDKEGYYHNKEEAWTGIQNICLQLNLPDPIIVDSGFGYHVYWPMVAGVPSADWRATTKLLYQALLVVEPKAVADASRISDSASVLRIPDTLNLKHGQQTPVWIAQWYSEHIDFGEFRDQLKRITGGSLTAPSVSLDVVPQEFEKSQLLPTLKNCNWAKTYIQNVADTSEPEWYAMLGIAAFVEHTSTEGKVLNGADVAHILSKGHPNYDYDATVAKFNQAKNAQTGPTTCAKLQQINAAPCEGCPFRGAVKSPVQTARLARPSTEPVIITAMVTEEGNKTQEDIVIPLPPSPYFRGESGGVYVRVKEKTKKDDGSEEWQERIIKVYDYDLYPVKRFRSELKEEEQLEIHLWLPKDGMIRFKMPTENLVEAKKTGAYLASRGALTVQGGSMILSKYLIDYARHMQTVESAEMEYAKFGWRDIRTDEPKFVVGNGIIDKHGKMLPAAFPSYLKQASTAVAAYGSLDKWKEAFNVYQNIPNSEAFIFTALMGFAAPGLALTPYAGVLYNMVGASGQGKSAALALMASVWGQPIATRVKLTDTKIARDNTIGYLNNIPVAFDEVTTMDAEDASEFALNFTGGRGKERASRSGENKDNHVSWETVVVCTSNTSMYSKFTEARKGYNAESMRLFEVNVPLANKKYQPFVDEALRALATNYGLAGRAFIPSIMRNKEQVAKAIEMKATQIMRLSGGSTSERFWNTLVACVYVMGSIAKQQGLHSYDMDKLMDWAMIQMGVVRETTSVASADAKAMLGEFINKNLDGMVRIRNGSLDLKTNVNSPRSIVGRLEFEGDQLTYAHVSVKALNDFCTWSRIDSSWLVTELKQAAVTDGISKSFRLATGTNFPNPTVRCYRMNLINQGIGLANEDQGEESSQEGSQEADERSPP